MASFARISELEPRQIARVGEIAAAWQRVERATSRADRDAAELAMEIVYRQSGWKTPRDIRWYASPAAAVEAIAGSSTGAALFAPGIGRYAAEPLQERFSPQMWQSLVSSFPRAPRDEFKSLVQHTIGTETKSVGAIVDRAGCGQHDARWVALYDVLERVFEIQAAFVMRGPLALARNCGWWWAYRDAAFLCERQTRLVRDERERAHCIDGPALAFADGSAAFAFHGVAVDAWLVEKPQDITVETIRNESNAEVRRVMIELFGPGRYLDELGATVVSEDDYGTLLRADVPGETEPFVMVRVVNASPEPDGTFRIYHLRVPPHVMTAHEAVAWTFGLSSQSYAPRFQS
jgi:hypothetical protein